jgi:UDP-N-acetyl-D-mannosaminuronic acid transferase (WecB/TagA/CpsF family)
MTSYRPRLNESQRKEILGLSLPKLESLLKVKKIRDSDDNKYTEFFELVDKFLHPEPLNKSKVSFWFWGSRKEVLEKLHEETKQRIKEIKTILKNGFPKTSENDGLEPIGRSV